MLDGVICSPCEKCQKPTPNMQQTLTAIGLSKRTIICDECIEKFEDQLDVFEASVTGVPPLRNPWENAKKAI